MYKRVIRKLIKILDASIKEKPKQVPVVEPENGLSTEELIADLDQIPLEEGAVVFIHSGFKSIGAIKGGPDTVIDALLKSFVEKRNITVAMPSFTISGTMEDSLTKGTKFDVRSSPTVFKDIPAAFLKYPNLERSVHPTHSVMAIGPKAKWLVENHHNCGTTFGVGSPFGKLLECKSYIMGLGSRLGTVTFYHALEDMEKDFPFRVYTENSPYPVKCVDWNGKTVKMNVSAHDGTISPVRIDRRNGGWLREIYTKIFEDKAGLRWFTVGKAKTWTCDASELYEIQKKLTFSGLSIYTTEQKMADYITDSLLSGDK